MKGKDEIKTARSESFAGVPGTTLPATYVRLHASGACLAAAAATLASAFLEVHGSAERPVG